MSGIYLLTDIRFAGEPSGVAWALANAALFTLYIILAHRIARADPDTRPIDRLEAAMLVAAMVITPLGLKGAIPQDASPRLLQVEYNRYWMPTDEVRPIVCHLTSAMIAIGLSLTDGRIFHRQNQGRPFLAFQSSCCIIFESSFGSLATYLFTKVTSPVNFRGLVNFI